MSSKQVARTAASAVRVSPVAILATASYGSAVAKLPRPFLTGRYFFITVAGEIACGSENSNLIFFSRKRRRPQNRRSALPALRYLLIFASEADQCQSVPERS